MQMNILKFILLLYLVCVSVYAQDMNTDNIPHPEGIVSSGLNTQVNYDNQTYTIKGGTQKGQNLFHSFERFNIHSNQRAIFQDAGIENTIGRITGNNYSWINGKLISDANNLFLINPNGVMFGPAASVDIQGSLFVSTADYIRFDSNDTFHARPQQTDVLSVAPPDAFGFYKHEQSNNQTGQIIISRNNELTIFGDSLHISLIAQDIHLKSGIFLVSNGGSINMITTGSEKELSIFQENDDQLNTGGSIQMDAASVQVYQGGQIYIKTGLLDMKNASAIQSLNFFASGGKIKVSGDTINLDHQSIIESYSSGQGSSSDIQCIANNLTLRNISEIKNHSQAQGNVGDIEIVVNDTLLMEGRKICLNPDLSEKMVTFDIKANSITLLGGSIIDSSAESGYVNDIYITANDTITIEGTDSNPSCIQSYLYDENTGGGNIEIKTKNMFLNENGKVFRENFNENSQPGKILIDADNLFSCSSGNIYHQGHSGNIYINAKDIQCNAANFMISTSNKEEPGSINFDAETIHLMNKSAITTNQGDYAQTNTGDIYLSANKYIHMTKSFITSMGVSTKLDEQDNPVKGGTIDIQTPQLLMKNNSKIYASAKSKSEGGTVQIGVNDLTLMDSHITTSTTGEGDAGNININASQTITIKRETDKAGLFCDSRFGATGNAGQIFVKAGQLNINNGNIDSDSQGSGKGGNIQVHAENILLENNASIFSGNLTPKHFLLADKSELSDLSNEDRKAGNTAEIIENDDHSKQDYIYTGLEWSIVANTYNIDHIDDISNPVTGDIAFIHRSEVIESYVHNSNNKWVNTTKGIAGNVDIYSTKNISLINSSVVTESKNAAGGKLSIKGPGTLFLLNSELTTRTASGYADAGDINIENNITILQNSKIAASANEGDGGAIFIDTDHYFQSNSTLDASSERGNDGDINIEAPDLDISNKLIALPSTTLDTSRLIMTPCIERSYENDSHLFVNKNDIMHIPFNDLQPNPPLMPGIFPENKHLLSKFKKGHDLLYNGQFKQAAQLFKDIKESSDNSIEAFYYMIHAYQMIGRHRNALYDIESILPIASEKMMTTEKAIILITLSDLYLSLGNTQKAMQYLYKGIEQAELTQKKFVMAMAYNHKGNYLTVSTANDKDKNYGPALDAYEKSIQYIEKTNFFPELKMAVLANLIKVKYLDNSPFDALQLILRTLPQIEKMNESFFKASTLISLNLVCWKIYQEQKNDELKRVGINMLKQALQTSKNINNQFCLSFSYTYLGIWAIEFREYETAKKYLNKALMTAVNGHYPEITCQCQWHLGRISKTLEKWNDSIKYYQRSIKTLENIRHHFYDGYKLNQFSEEIRPIYEELSEVYIQKAKHHHGKKQEQYLIHAMTALENLKQAEFENFYKDECILNDEAKMITRTVSGTALIYPVVLENKLVLITTLSDKIIFKELDVKSEKINYHAKKFKESVLNMNEGDLYYANKFYDWFIRPIKKELTLQQVERLIISPGLSLGLIPFSALHDGKKFLIEQYELITVPAITLSKQASLKSDKNRVLLCGLSQGLPGVKDEIKKISEIMGDNCSILMDSQFTYANIKKELKLKKYNIIHFTTHAWFGNSLSDTFIKAYDMNISMDHLEQLVKVRKYDRQKLDLIVLNGCQTAMGNERAWLGLAGAALKAGAKNAVATLWRIEDKSSSQIMIDFYTHLVQSKEIKTYILQKALLNYLKNPVHQSIQSKAYYEKMFFWAPYIYVGLNI